MPKNKSRQARRRRQEKATRRKRRQERPSRSAPGPTPSLAKLAEEIQAQGVLPDAQVVINPPGQDKMSEVLGEFIGPYVDATETEHYEKLVALATVAWNAALMPDDERAGFLEEILGTLPADLRPEAKAFVAQLIRRKQAYFPDNKRYILDVRVTDMGDSYHLAVVSLLQPGWPPIDNPPPIVVSSSAQE